MAEPVKNIRLKSFNYKYNRRKTTLMKKANQLSKLCDVKVCMVCFGPDKTVETWPGNRSEVCDVFSKYKSGCLGNMGREKKHNLVGFLENKQKKLEEKSKQKIMKNLVGGYFYSTWDKRLDRFSEEELMGLYGWLDSKLQNLRDKINLKKEKNQEALVVHSPPDNNNNNNIDHNLNMFNNFYQPPQPLWFSGDCSTFNQQAFSGSDALLGRVENFSVYGQNYGNNYMGSNMINNGFLLENTNMGMAGQSSRSNIDNNFRFDEPMVNYQGLYDIFPIAIRPPLPISNQSI